jgi:hypothetical protein
MLRKIIFILFFLFAACTNRTPQPQSTSTELTGTNDPTATVIPNLTVTESVPLHTTTPQAPPTPVRYGPEEFPEGYNPLSAQRVKDSSLLDIPALLISISHFPPAARPQAGMSFAPFVFEYFITEGATRYLAVFHGEAPEPEIPLHGNCDVRREPIPRADLILGNRVWHDQNENGVQDAGEGGIGGICVSLLNANGNRIAQTTTDSNGYYGFNVKEGEYTIKFENPAGVEFTQANAGEEGTDSDVDPKTGQIGPIGIHFFSLLFWDAGLVTSARETPTPDPSAELPAAQVGPVRSGRLLYRHIGNFYQDSCLIYASADPVVLEQIPGCATVPHTVAGGGAMLAIERMQRIQEQVTRDTPRHNYTGNLFLEEASEGGQPAHELHEYWALLNQTKWMYDAASESWWRYVDESDPDTVGMLHADTDRLTGRQLKFENIILLFAEHVVITPTIVDINMQVGQSGRAHLFRDGQVYEIRWSTRAGKYEQTTGLRRPIQFLNPDGTPAALKPGHTWVIIFNLDSRLEELSPGSWRARFVAPAGAKNE